MAKAPVPDTETVRQAALRASWRRDRWVARRRLLGRWLLWCLRRYVLPIVLIVGLGLLLWLGAWPSLRKPIEPTRPAAVSSVPLPPPRDAGLRLDTHWPTTTTAQAPVQTTPPAPLPSQPTSPSHLKPENRLHSKEP
ncbi:MAG: hypothetical protein A2W72_17720 [Burkholderiales bacterium RIFCSPLOWO2_12_67_14]|nr:MAG: hypothetical protein A3I64_01145 [Burkholderiales bacterium RIFCSPLOWO2_02_FULL_67_64]OGB39882.1 MAG: hypothetical protein A2W72_17720 [Burkholderiales bacterium RIFCSPLOWO2_12_67_14]OGB51532.1 MAG: hypothetical protein A3E51_26480 [Burkholderiales bacterium RIFCSPHIGHO2_12_FULL_67_38]OGB84827.1 MAG: hypothetical protein A3G82_20725 [Burkholderiales bacterium RIFCSPLOWO2_12_FULL_67_210]